MKDLRQFLEHCPTGQIWKRIGIRHHHGIDTPLASLTTKNSCGIGEYLDLLPLIDYLSDIGFDTLQLLPLNDTGWDSSPYNALSSCALHPIYLSLRALPFLDRAPDLVENLKPLERHNKPQHIPYHLVLEDKYIWLTAYIERFGKEFLQLDAYQKFLKENAFVEPYAIYKALKDHFDGKPWKEWPEDLRDISHVHLKKLVETYEHAVHYHSILQYLCFEQLSSAKRYANSRGVFLKGDIPILINPDSVDVWLHRDFFDTSIGVGSPPDQFTPLGQNWGFPAYRWQVLANQGYGWWRERLHYASHFYDLYRLDHILGFFRLFIIPHGKSPIEGSYVPEREDLMLLTGRTLLENFIRFSPMLPIGEDLGIVPKGVQPTMTELGICGTRVFRWEERPQEEFSPITLTTISTHDSETLEIWWRERPEDVKNYCKLRGIPYEKELTPKRRFQILKESHASPSLFHINLFGEYLALFPELIWPRPEDERINIPGFINPTNWNYRYHKPLEEIITHVELKKSLIKIISSN